MSPVHPCTHPTRSHSGPQEASPSPQAPSHPCRPELQPPPRMSFESRSRSQPSPGLCGNMSSSLLATALRSRCFPREVRALCRGRRAVQGSSPPTLGLHSPAGQAGASPQLPGPVHTCPVSTWTPVLLPQESPTPPAPARWPGRGDVPPLLTQLGQADRRGRGGAVYSDLGNLPDPLPLGMGSGGHLGATGQSCHLAPGNLLGHCCLVKAQSPLTSLERAQPEVPRSHTMGVRGLAAGEEPARQTGRVRRRPCQPHPAAPRPQCPFLRLSPFGGRHP